MSKYSKRMIFNGVIALLAVVLMITVAVLCKDAELSEKATRTVTFAFTEFFGRISSAVPFSVFETFAFIAAAVALFLIIKGIVMLAKRQPARGLCSFTTLIATVLAVVSVYMLDTSFAYNRQKPPLEIYKNGDITDEELLDATNDFMQDFILLSSEIERDNDGFPVCDYSVSELSELIVAEYEKLQGGYYCDYVPEAKGMAFSAIMSESYLTGITFTPIGEANVNKETPVSSLIFTIAHETAHAVGIMREEDANLMAAYVLINSDNDLLRYSAMYNYFDRMLWIMYYLDKDAYEDYASWYDSSLVKREIKAEKAFWETKGAFNAISDFFNNIYLKLNGQDLGTDSYVDSNFSDADPSEPDDDGNVTYALTLSDIQLAFVTRYHNG